MIELEYTRFIEAEAIYAESGVKVEILKQPIETVFLRAYDAKLEQIEMVDQSMRLRGFVRVTEVKLDADGPAVDVPATVEGVV